MATVIKSIGTGPSRDYSTLAAALADYPNIAENGDTLIFEHYGDSVFADDVDGLFDAWADDPDWTTGELIVAAATGETVVIDRTDVDGSYLSVFACTTGNTLTFRVRDLEFINLGGGTGGLPVLSFSCAGNATHAYVERVKFTAADVCPNPDAVQSAIQSCYGSIEAHACIFDGRGHLGTHHQTCFFLSNYGVHRVGHCVIAGVNKGIHTYRGAVEVVNIVFVNVNIPRLIDSGQGSITGSNNGSTGVLDWCESVDLIDPTNEFVSYALESGNNDYRLKAAALLVDAGASAETFPWLTATDFLGRPWIDPRDIGAYRYADPPTQGPVGVLRGPLNLLNRRL